MKCQLNISDESKKKQTNKQTNKKQDGLKSIKEDSNLKRKEAPFGWGESKLFFKNTNFAL